MEEYAGFGPGAYSDFDGVRYAYVRDLDSYISGRLILSESESDATLPRDYEYVMLSPVSYTHLDVYKRQVSGGASIGVDAFCLEAGLDRRYAVSGRRLRR